MGLYIINYTTSSRMITFLDSIVSDPVIANIRKAQLEEDGYIPIVRGPVSFGETPQVVALFIRE